MIRTLGWLALHHGLGRGLTFAFFLALPLVLPMAEVGRFTLVYTVLLLVVQPLFEGPLELLLSRAAADGALGTVRRIFALVLRVLPPMLLAVWLVGVALGATGLLLFLLLAHLGLARLQAAVFATLRGLERTRLEGIVGLLQRALMLVVLVVMARLLPGRAEAPAAALLVGVSGGWLLTLVGFRQELGELVARVHAAEPAAEAGTGEEGAQVWRQALVLGVAGLLGALYLRVDAVFLGVLTDTTEVGRYTTAARVLEATYALPHLLMLALLPRLVKAPEFARTFTRSALALLGLGALAAAALAWLAPLLLPWLYREEGAAVATLVVALAPAAVAVYLGFLATQGLVVLGRAKTWLGLALIGLVVNVVLNLALIPSYGARGAAWATVATEVMVAVSAALVCLGSARARRGPEASICASKS